MFSNVGKNLIHIKYRLKGKTIAKKIKQKYLQFIIKK